MLNKRIKSLLVAGLLILGMSGQAFADVTLTGTSPVSEFVNNPAYGMPSKEFENGNIVVNLTSNASNNHKEYNCKNIEGSNEQDHSDCVFHPANTYQFIIDYNAEQFTMTQMNLVIGDETIILKASDLPDAPKDIADKAGWKQINFTMSFDGEIDGLELAYEPAGSTGEEELTIEEQIIKNYIDQMNTTNVGIRDNNTGIRTIGKEYAISKEDWEEFITKLEVNFDVTTVAENDSYGEYNVISRISGGDPDGIVIETIKIDFFDAKGAKGWIPEITPGTGQALAVGGIVIGAAAAVGLLVNNRKRKDEE